MYFEFQLVYMTIMSLCILPLSYYYVYNFIFEPRFSSCSQTPPSLPAKNMITKDKGGMHRHGKSSENVEQLVSHARTKNKVSRGLTGVARQVFIGRECRHSCFL